MRLHVSKWGAISFSLTRLLWNAYLVTLFRSIVQHPYIIVHIKAEQRPRFPSCLVDNEVVEGVVLRQTAMSVQVPPLRNRATYMRNDQILLDVHHVVNTGPTQFRELCPAFFQELSDVVALFALFRNCACKYTHQSLMHGRAGVDALAERTHCHRTTSSCPTLIMNMNRDLLRHSSYDLCHPSNCR